MQHHRHGSNGSRKSGEPALVTDTAVMTEADSREVTGPREGDVLYGLRIALALSAVLWAGLIFLGFLIFG